MWASPKQFATDIHHIDYREVSLYLVMAIFEYWELSLYLVMDDLDEEAFSMYDNIAELNE